MHKRTGTDEIQHHQRQQAKKRAVYRIIIDCFQENCPLGQDPDGKGHSGCGVHFHVNHCRFTSVQSDRKQEVPVGHDVRGRNYAASRALLPVTATRIFCVQSDRIRHWIFKGDVKFPGCIRPVDKRKTYPYRRLRKTEVGDSVMYRRCPIAAFDGLLKRQSIGRIGKDFHISG